MPVEIKMPALSPTMEEGTLAKWLVKEGDVVKSGDLMAEIETDKATMEFEAVDEGTIGKILVAEGTDNVKVGTVIATLLEDGESAGDTTPEPAAKESEPKPSAEDPTRPAAKPSPSSARPSRPRITATPRAVLHRSRPRLRRPQHRARMANASRRARSRVASLLKRASISRRCRVPARTAGSSVRIWTMPRPVRPRLLRLRRAKLPLHLRRVLRLRPLPSLPRSRTFRIPPRSSPTCARRSRVA